MVTKKTYRALFFFAIGILFMAQAAPKTKDQLKEEAIQAKMDVYIENLIRKCEKSVQKRALEIVDSMLLKEAQFKTVDTFERPQKPRRPQKPAVKQAKDTTDVKPLFDQ